MARSPGLLPVLALLGGLLTYVPGPAQTPASGTDTNSSPETLSPPPSLGKPSGSQTDQDALPYLPQIPNQPRSLYAPAAPGTRVYPPEHPYFVPDPLLDPAGLPPPGWFGEVDAAIVSPHLKNRLVNAVQVGSNPPDIVKVEAADLDWTATPRLSAGYRLPSGFGEFFVTYQFLTSQGTSSGVGLAGPAQLQSRLDFNLVDLTYASREISLWPCADVKWWIGGRLAYTYFDSQGDSSLSPLTPAAPLEQRTTNSTVGFGPHAGLLLEHHLSVPGLSLYGRLDLASLYGRVRQQFSETVVPLTPGGPNFGAVGVSGTQGIPIVNAQAGLSWQPPKWGNTHLFVGYVYEHWWSVGLLNPAIFNPSSGEFYYQGPVLRAECHF